MNAERDRQWTRRQFLGAAGIAAGGVLLPPPLRLPGARTASASGFAAGHALRAAMHVHGSWSEGLGSWEAQFGQAAANGFDLLYLTDHDHKALAMDSMAALSDVPMVSSSTGSFAQKAATASYGALRLLAESSSTTQSASVTLAVQPSPAAANRLRTSIAGLTITQTLTSAALTNGARYEVVVPLSYHPAASGRPAGQYKLVYRFGVARGRWTEGSGLTGVVGAPTPAAGSVQTLSPETDAASLWPDMLAIDNVTYGLSFVARSPKRTAVADVSVRSVTFARTGNTAAAVIGNQARIIQTYEPRFPGVAAHATTEISEGSPHLNPFGIPPWLPDYSSLSTSHDTRYRQLVAQVHGMGGTISWNHPFGSTTGPLLSATERVAKRRKVFSSMQAVDLFGADILEVAFTLRGQVDAATHLALWDTFSRRGRFLTGNGTSDDHSGKGWSSLDNGFATGLWAASSSDGDVVRALAAGRAFAAHVGRWPGGEMDVLVDGTVPMGAVSISSRTSRQLAVSAANLPAGSTVQLVAGPVDYSGQVDPGTWIVTALPASAFAAGPCTVPVDTSSSRFYRAQVVASGGGLVGTANPVWLLRQAPPAGVPPARAA